MKKLGKLSINVDKIMKNEELVNLRGGDYYYGENKQWYHCECVDSSGYVHFEEDILTYTWGAEHWEKDACWDIHTGTCELI